jgi:hypothetical protein
MKIADISVSRVHSFIKIVNDLVIIDDNGSKFGTLVKMNKPQSIISILDENGEEYNKNYKFNATIY